MTVPEDPFAPPGGSPAPGYPPTGSPPPLEDPSAAPYGSPYGTSPTGYGGGGLAQTGFSPSGQPLSSRGRRFGGALLSFVLVIVTLGIGYLIWAILSWQKSTTPAKRIMKMTVVDANTGAPLEFGKMALRQVVFGAIVISVVPFLSLIDAIMIFFGDKNQRLVDRMAGTLVVDGVPPAAP
jgi:uncharacterized RDD family membrane protein YckC